MTVVPVNHNLVQRTNDNPALQLNPGDILNLSANAGIFAYGTGALSHGVAASGANILNLAGSIFSREASGIFSATGNHIVSITASGSIASYLAGIELQGGGSTVTNAGRISGGDSAISLGGGDNVFINNGAVLGRVNVSSNNSVTNNGTIEADVTEYAVSTGGSCTVVNTGTIRGGGGVFIPDGSTLTNSGTIFAIDQVCVDGNSGGQTVINTGLIQAAGPVAIDLAAGGDLYDGRGGRVIGEVLGANMNDTLLGGAFVDIFRGGEADDRLNGGGAADFLDGGNGNDTFELGADTSDTIGDASGIDTVTSTITRSLGTWVFMENLILQGAAAINGTGNAAFNSIVGNGANNLLAGQAGNDVLVGGGGNDQLFGQADKDNLTGGAGDDRFGFQTVAHTAAGTGDVIVDFDDSGDDIMDLTGIIPGVLMFIGGAAFTAANQVRYQQVGANVLVEINTAGNTTAEGQITLLNTTIGNAAVGQVNAADFLL
jgi:Ca2+-binding RTX toxin-like protein